ncbi:MAG TPA: aminotransferase class V-fold PLP-dependent enzyme [Bryobacteraceae bacterium]|nr:aminotransferase class V-fold PLP-dependent enzyme [Bryobacteraceae bacterium]
MGYETLTGAGQELWKEYQDHFPVTQNLVYLNHAGVAPLCRRAAEAMKHLADDAMLYGSHHYDKWLDAYQGLRVATAKLIHADPKEIAIVKNTSEGISMVATGIDWRPGDRIIAFREEFPANVFPWKRLERKGICVEWLSFLDPIDRIEEAVRGARLLSTSFVQYLSGYRTDLKTIGEICHRHGTLFFVDAIQGLGAFPLDVKACRIHALAADGHKWLLGPEGCGILYIQKDIQDSIEPSEFGWTNVASYNDFSCRELTLRNDAGRYECGTLNTVGIYGLRAAVQFLLEVGIDRVAPAIQSLGDRVADAVTARGYSVLQPRTVQTGAGIVSFQKQGIDSRLVVSRLRDAGFEAAPRQGWVRVSPHFYIDPAEMDHLAATLP